MLRLSHRILAQQGEPQVAVWDEGQYEYAVRGFRFLHSVLLDGSATVIVADNVEDYASENVQQFMYDDFPNAIPPVSPLFIEWNVCEKWRSSMPADVAISQFGMLMDTCAVEDTPEALWDGTDDANAMRVASKWAVKCHLFFTQKGIAISSAIGGVMLLNKDGAVVGFLHSLDSELADSLLERMCVPLLAISFCHCKNVKVADETSAHQPDAKWIRRKRLPQIIYKVLEINPAKEVLANEGGAAANGLKKALHICRGHFVHYTDEHPLFGKYTGRFWKAAHVRGDLRHGAVIKDYSVRAK